MTEVSVDAPRRRRAGAERWLRSEIAAAAKSGVRRASVLGALAAALAVPQAWLLANAIAPVVMQKASVSSALPWLLPVLPLLGVRFVLAAASGRSALAAAAKVKSRIRSMLLRHLASLGPAATAGRSTGEAATVVLEGVDALDAYVSRYLAHLGVLAVLPLLVLAVVLPRDWISGLVLLATAPVIPLFMVLLGLGAERLNRQQWLRLMRLSGRLLDGLQRLTTLRLLNAGDREAERLAEAAEDYRRSTMAVLRVAFLTTLALEFFAVVGIALVAVLIGFRLLDGELDFETAFFVLLLAPEFYAPLRQLGLDYHARMESLAAVERILDLRATTPLPAGTRRPPLGTAITIECDAVGFAWEPDRPAVRELSLRIAPGEIVALVGPSGSGKSTLLSLLLGFVHPQSGRILVNGHDLAGLDPAHWLGHVAVVPQRPHMFAGSVLDNIRLGNPDAGLDQVRAAARRAAADAFIMALPQGYDTPLGEHGETLSGGQVQRVALARAFLKEQAGVLLLDEGTAGLDRDTEAAVVDAIRRLAIGRTTLIVTHRLATVHLADRVVFLDEGGIVEQGPRAEIASGDGRFASLLREAGLSP
ncbi:thiol reductant ABC exporter subunit CydD [Reyranella aquatilis]|uniref:Thiol reductant ABC exporter subunit CydD n=1 Tax=Reyranella aquatilis TaxID=2035356 RepID=A0ABS8KTZ2_9HYPH|nr:thiol reductant ABC exporter subunit CydD [Reyranella aquatilis]MCC8429546.1 thiol reductant ABC exporter subunit CydD [Reyranella aquatilis]